MTHDYTIRYRGKSYQIARSAVRPGLRGGRVRVERRLDGSLAVRFRQHYLTVTECPPSPQRTPTSRPVRSPRPRPATPRRWMQDFDLPKGPPLWTILQRPTPPRPDTGSGKPREPV